MHGRMALVINDSNVINREAVDVHDFGVESNAWNTLDRRNVELLLQRFDVVAVDVGIDCGPCQFHWLHLNTLGYHVSQAGILRHVERLPKT